jgi:hypothetical protein
VAFLNILLVLRPGKGGCADPVYEDAILGGVREGPPGRNKERQLEVKWEGDRKTKKTTPSRLKATSMHRVS